MILANGLNVNSLLIRQLSILISTFCKVVFKLTIFCSTSDKRESNELLWVSRWFWNRNLNSVAKLTLSFAKIAEVNLQLDRLLFLILVSREQVEKSLLTNILFDLAFFLLVLCLYLEKDDLNYMFDCLSLIVWRSYCLDYLWIRLASRIYWP